MYSIKSTGIDGEVELVVKDGVDVECGHVGEMMGYIGLGGELA